MMISRPLRLLYVEWDDAASLAEWLTRAEVETFAHGSWLVRQVGIVLEDSDHHLVLAGAWCPEEGWHPERFGDVTRIPRPWIRRRRALGTVTEQGLNRVPL